MMWKGKLSGSIGERNVHEKRRVLFREVEGSGGSVVVQ